MANILLVEDSPEVSLTVTEILEQEGHTVATAGNGDEALEAVAKTTFDLIVSDVWMPGTDGISLLKELRSSGNNVPVIVISGGAPNAPLSYTAPLASTFGADAVLYKPFEMDELIAAVNEALAV